MCVEVIYVELLYCRVMMCTALCFLFSLSSIYEKELKKKKNIGEKREKKRMEKILDPFSACFGKKRKKSSNVIYDVIISSVMK